MLSDIFLSGGAVMTPPTTGAIFQLVDPAGKLVAAKINVYAGEDDEYKVHNTRGLFISTVMHDVSQCVWRNVTKDSWVMRDLWNATKLLKEGRRRKD
jgi:hypothetical protein